MKRYLIIFCLFLFSCAKETRESVPVYKNDTTFTTHDLTVFDSVTLENPEELKSSENFNVRSNEFLDLEKGQVKYSFPKHLKFGTVGRVKVQISKKQFEKILSDSLNKNINTQIQNIKIRSEMSVKLYPSEEDCFKVVELNNPRQPVEGDEPTTWEWNIKPLKMGEFSIRVVAIAHFDNGDNSKDIIVFEENVVVESLPKDEWYYQIQQPNNFSQGKKTVVTLQLKKNPTSSGWYAIKLGKNIKIQCFDRHNLITCNPLSQTDLIDLTLNSYEFSWELSAVRSGKSNLVIKIIDSESVVEVYDNTFEIKKQFLYSIKNNYEENEKYWTWAFTTLIIPIFMFFKKWYQNRKKASYTIEMLNLISIQERDIDAKEKINNLKQIDIDFAGEIQEKGSSTYSRVCRFINATNEDFQESEIDLQELKDIYRTQINKLKRKYFI